MDSPIGSQFLPSRRRGHASIISRTRTLLSSTLEDDPDEDDDYREHNEMESKLLPIQRQFICTAFEPLDQCRVQDSQHTMKFSLREDFSVNSQEIRRDDEPSLGKSDSSVIGVRQSVGEDTSQALALTAEQQQRIALNRLAALQRKTKKLLAEMQENDKQKPESESTWPIQSHSLQSQNTEAGDTKPLLEAPFSATDRAGGLTLQKQQQLEASENPQVRQQQETARVAVAQPACRVLTARPIAPLHITMELVTADEFCLYADWLRRKVVHAPEYGEGLSGRKLHGRGGRYAFQTLQQQPQQQQQLQNRHEHGRSRVNAVRGQEAQQCGDASKQEEGNQSSSSQSAASALAFVMHYVKVSRRWHVCVQWKQQACRKYWLCANTKLGSLLRQSTM